MFSEIHLCTISSRFYFPICGFAFWSTDALVAGSRISASQWSSSQSSELVGSALLGGSEVRAEDRRRELTGTGGVQVCEPSPLRPVGTWTPCPAPPACCGLRSPRGGCAPDVAQKRGIRGKLRYHRYILFLRTLHAHFPGGAVSTLSSASAETCTSDGATASPRGRATLALASRCGHKKPSVPAAEPASAGTGARGCSVPLRISGQCPPWLRRAWPASHAYAVVKDKVTGSFTGVSTTDARNLTQTPRWRAKAG